ncbi:MAG: tetratricopeptide repeat protein [Acidobacteriota bacterium]
MTVKTQKNTRKAISFITLIFFLLGVSAFALQEEKISTLSDYLYKKDLAKYEEAKAGPDNQQKADAMAALIKERPISRILLYAATDYIRCAAKIAGNNSDKLISMAQTLSDLIPTDAEIQAEAKYIPVGLDDFKKQHLAPSRQLVQRTLADAYLQKKDFAKAAEYAEKAYAISPDKQLVQTLFGLYTQLGNEAKIMSYGQKMLQQFSMKEKEGYTTALQLADIYLKKQDMKSATQLFSKLMDAYGNSVPPGMQEANWNSTRAVAYTLMAQDAYTKQNYTKAEQLYQKVLTFDSRRDDAYYYLGMCRWKAKDQAGAIVYFARCMVLNKTLASKAKQYLDQLFKAEYPNAEEGDLEKIINQARSDLRI